MARILKAKAGYEFVTGALNPKTGRKYSDPRSVVLEKSSGRMISRREYIKRTEGIPSLEFKARRRARYRLVQHIRNPQEQYKSAVSIWHKTRGESARTRGESAEALEFQDLYARIKSLYRRGRGAWTKKDLREYFRVQRDFGLFTEQEYRDMLAKYIERRK